MTISRAKIPDSEALPVERKRRKKRGAEAATQEQRNAMRFEKIKLHFDWTNEDWAAAWLPWVRLAAAQVELDDVKLERLMAGLVKDGEAPNLLEGWSRLKAHLQAVVKLSDVALDRSFLVLERLGYSPDNLPPDQPVH
jgi:hypothetical protein